MKHTQTSPAPEGATPAPRGDALSASSIFGATLLRCAEASSSPDTPATSFCWLLAMGRQLGLPDDELVALALPYPRLADLLRRQIDQLSARAAAARADERDEVNLAIAAYLQHIASCPYDQETRLTFCRALLDRGEVDAAEALYERGSALMEGPLLMALKAELLMARGRFEQAHVAASDALEHAPLHPEVLITFADSCRWMARDEARREALERALELHAHHPLALSRHLEAPDPSWAPEERLAEAQRLFAEHPARHRHHALVLAQLEAGRVALAVDEARRLLGRHPQSLSARLALSRALLARGALKEAASELLEVMERSPSLPDALWLWARLSLATANVEALESALERLAELALAAPSVSLLYLDLLAALGDDEAVHEGYARLMERHPLSRPAQRSYARYMLSVGLSQSALELCALLLERAPRDLEARCLAAEACVALGSSAQARRHLKRCGQHPRARLAQGRLDLAAGRLAAARRASHALLEWSPADPDAVELAIQCAAREEHNDEALLSLYRSLTLERLSGRSLALLSFLLTQIGRLDEAHEALDQLLATHVYLPFESVYYACEAARAARRADVLLRLSAPPPPEPSTERARQVIFYRAVGLWFDGQLDEALDLLESLHLRSELGVDALIALVVWACELGRAELSAAALARLVELDPAGDDVSPALLRQLQGRVALLSPQLPEARAALYDLMESALEQEDDEVLRVLTWALEAGLAAEVVELTEHLLAARPGSPLLWLLAARAHRDLTERDAALYSFERWRDLSPPEHTHPLLEWAELLELDGQRARAQELLDELCASDPEAHSYRLERALFLVRAGQLGAAEVELWGLLDVAREEDEELSLGELPLGPAAENVLSLLLSQAYHSAELSELHALVERLLARLGDAPTLRGFLGLTLRALGDHDASLEPLKEGAAHDLYFGSEYAHALWESGARREAVGALLECAVAAPHTPEHHEDLVRFLLELEDPQGALDHLLRLQALTPDAEGLDELTRLVYEALGAH